MLAYTYISKRKFRLIRKKGCNHILNRIERKVNYDIHKAYQNRYKDLFFGA